MNTLRSKESDAKKLYKNVAMDSQLADLLAAPDVFTTAAMMQMGQMFFGNGDFKKAVVLLGESAQKVSDLGRKLVLLKTGYFFCKELFNIDEQMNETQLRGEGLGAAQALKLFKDAGRHLRSIDHQINQKLVFKLWANHVYGGAGSMTQQQIVNIFPEFAHKLELYHQCCDKTGKIVKHQDFYKQYKVKPHFHSRRGGL